MAAITKATQKTEKKVMKDTSEMANSDDYVTYLQEKMNSFVFTMA